MFCDKVSVGASPASVGSSYLMSGLVFFFLFLFELFWLLEVAWGFCPSAASIGVRSAGCCTSLGEPSIINYCQLLIAIAMLRGLLLLTLAMAVLAPPRTDLYKVLGLERGAAESDIKKAFRRLSAQWHPDVNSSPEAKDKFIEIQRVS